MEKMSHVSVREKIAYAMGDASANIACRGVAAFLFIVYTDVFGLNPAAVGTLMLVARLGDGVSDVAMGVVADRTKTRWGKYRPWMLWSALPLGVMLSMMFTCTESLFMTGRLVYAYGTYIVFTLVYTAQGIPYGALLAVMSPDDCERTSIGSYKMVGAFAGGMLVQGLLLVLKERTRPVPEVPGDYPDPHLFGGVLPAYGLYARHVDALTLDNVSFSLKPNTTDSRPDISFEDVK